MKKIKIKRKVRERIIIKKTELNPKGPNLDYNQVEVILSLLNIKKIPTRYWIIITSLFFISLLTYVFFSNENQELREKSKNSLSIYGLDSLSIIEENVILNDILLNDLLEKILEPQILQIQGIQREYIVRRGAKYMLIGENIESYVYKYVIIVPNPFEYVRVDLISSEIVEIKRKSETRYQLISGIVQTDFGSSLVGKKLPINFMEELEDVISSSMDLHHLEIGDRYKIIFTEQFADGRFVKFSRIEGISFESQQKYLSAFYFDHPSVSGYFDINGKSLETSFLKAPVRYSRISSLYGLRRHPISRTNKLHKGTDYVANYGSDVFSVADGRVIDARYNKRNGNYIKIKHTNGYETLYLHLSSFNEKIKPGFAVKKGEIIGYVGSSGDSTGPHVCFNLKKEGIFVNHLEINFEAENSISRELLPLFTSKVDSIVRRMEMIQY